MRYDAGETVRVQSYFWGGLLAALIFRRYATFVPALIATNITGKNPHIFGIREGKAK